MIIENIYEQIFSSDGRFLKATCLPVYLPKKTKAGKAGSVATSWRKKQLCMREKDVILKFRDCF
jgi:hypothetical protein